MDTLDHLARYAVNRGWGIAGYLLACDQYREQPEYWQEQGWPALERWLDAQAVKLDGKW